MVNTWLNNAQFWLLPGRCVVCSDSSGRNFDLCPACEAELAQPWPCCRHCGLPATANTEFCGYCVRERFSFTRCIALSPYQPPIDRLIARLKYQRHLSCGKVLGQLLARHLEQQYRDDSRPDTILPVPLHWARQWRRGFNQADYLAAILGSAMDIPLQRTSLARTRATHTQQGMNRRERQRNLRQVFDVARPLSGRHIALVDDVVTTGSTANLLSAALLKHGAERVDVWCLARTPAKG